MRPAQRTEYENWLHRALGIIDSIGEPKDENERALLAEASDLIMEIQRRLAFVPRTSTVEGNDKILKSLRAKVRARLSEFPLTRIIGN